MKKTDRWETQRDTETESKQGEVRWEVNRKLNSGTHVKCAGAGHLRDLEYRKLPALWTSDVSERLLAWRPEEAICSWWKEGLREATYCQLLWNVKSKCKVGELRVCVLSESSSEQILHSIQKRRTGSNIQVCTGGWGVWGGGWIRRQGYLWKKIYIW